MQNQKLKNQKTTNKTEPTNNLPQTQNQQVRISSPALKFIVCSSSTYKGCLKNIYVWRSQ